jgi:hypothetical protein
MRMNYVDEKVRNKEKRLALFCRVWDSNCGYFTVEEIGKYH